ncbi:hypothetical protein N8865_02780 [Francisellaceae bacterium]|nr:hypothetical protein [Francisellaceae bacterium]
MIKKLIVATALSSMLLVFPAFSFSDSSLSKDSIDHMKVFEAGVMLSEMKRNPIEGMLGGMKMLSVFGLDFGAKELSLQDIMNKLNEINNRLKEIGVKIGEIHEDIKNNQQVNLDQEANTQSIRVDEEFHKTVIAAKTFNTLLGNSFPENINLSALSEYMESGKATNAQLKSLSQFFTGHRFNDAMNAYIFIKTLSRTDNHPLLSALKNLMIQNFNNAPAGHNIVSIFESHNEKLFAYYLTLLETMQYSTSMIEIKIIASKAIRKHNEIDPSDLSNHIDEPQAAQQTLEKQQDETKEIVVKLRNTFLNQYLIPQHDFRMKNSAGESAYYDSGFEEKK